MKDQKRHRGTAFSKTVGAVFVLVLIMGLQVALAQGSKKKAKTSRPKKQITVESFPEIPPSPQAALPKSEPRFKKKTKKYDDALLDQLAVQVKVFHEEPENSSEISGEKAVEMQANRELRRTEVRFDLRAKFESRDAVAVALGLMEDDGTVNFKECIGSRLKEDGTFEPCGYYMTAWTFGGTKKDLKDFKDINHYDDWKNSPSYPVPPENLAGKVGGWTYSEFTQALGYGAKKLDNWYEQHYWGANRADVRMVVGGVVGLAVMGTMVKKYRNALRKEAEVQQAVDAGKVAKGTMADLTLAEKISKGWINTFFVGPLNRTYQTVTRKNPAIKEAPKYRTKTKILVASFSRDVAMFSIGSGITICTFVGKDMTCGIIGYETPTIGSGILKLLVDGKADDEIKEMGHATAVLSDVQCEIGTLLPDEAGFKCGNDARLKAIEKFSAAKALAQSSQEEALELEEDEGNLEAFLAYEKKMAEEREKLKKKVEQDEWFSQRGVEISEIVPNKLLPDVPDIGFDVLNASLRRFFKAKVRRSIRGTRPQPVFQPASHVDASTVIP